MLFSLPLYAETWCTWSGTQGENCRGDSRGFIRALDGHPIGPPESNYNYHDFYKLVVTQPTIGADQVKDAVVWGFVANEITKTWTVRDMTATEIDERDSGAMDITDYYLWKVLLVTGVLTQQQAVNRLPADMVDAFQSRERLLGED